MADINPWLSDREAAEFLAKRWQREAQFFPASLPQLPDPPDWRALTARDDVESRRIVTTPAGTYRLCTGLPENADPQDPWTVLIQDADYHHSPLAALFDALPFLPRWRHEDIMMSVASKGGSVGPHVDRYDVFLVQARGTRHWRVGHAGTGVPQHDGEDLRLVQPFTADFEVEAAPGDVLYLPPGVPHHGVATSDCVTYSIGFRAPALTELAAVLLSHTDADALLGDAGRAPASDAWTLDRATLKAAREQLQGLLDDDHALAHALGELVTEPKTWLLPEELDEAEAHALWRALADEPDARLELTPGTRVALWQAKGQHGLYANGTGYALSSPAERAFAAALSERQSVALAEHGSAQHLILQLLGDGALRAAGNDDQPLEESNP